MAEFKTNLKFVVDFVGAEAADSLKSAIDDVAKAVKQIDDKNVQEFKDTLIEADQAIKEISRRSLSELSAGFKRLGSDITSVGKSLSLKITAPLTALGAIAVKEFGEAEKSLAKVEAGLKSTGNAAGFTSDELVKIAGSLQKVTTFGDDDILGNVTATLLTFTNITEEQFVKAQEAVVNLSARLGTDLQSSAIQVGKALNDPVSGLTSLTRAGVQFTEEQKALIESLVATGDVAAAQTVILKELEVQFGGTAQAIAKAGTGPITQLKNNIGDLFEQFGKIILEFANPLINFLNNVAIGFQTLDPSIKTAIVVIAGLAAAIGPVLLAFGSLITLGAPVLAFLTSAAAGFVSLSAIFTPFGAAIAAVVAAFVVLEAKFGTVSTVADGLFSILKNALGIINDLINPLGLLSSAFSSTASGVSFLFDAFVNLLGLGINGFFALFFQYLSLIADIVVKIGSLPIVRNLVPKELLDRISTLNLELEGASRRLVSFKDEAEKGVDLSNVLQPSVTSREGPVATSGSAAGVDLTNVLQATATATEEVDENLNQIAVKGRTVGDVLSDSFSSSFSQIATGSATALGAFRNFADGVLQSLTQIALKSAFTSAFGNLFPVAAAAPVAPGFASGGLISGAGTGTSDSIPARLSNGEFVVRQRAVSAIGISNLDALNKLDFKNLNLPKFASGGAVGFADGGSVSSPNVQINVQNNGAEKSVAVTDQSFDGKNLILSIILDDINNNGSVSQGLGGAFGLKRRA